MWRALVLVSLSCCGRVGAPAPDARVEQCIAGERRACLTELDALGLASCELGAWGECVAVEGDGGRSDR